MGDPVVGGDVAAATADEPLLDTMDIVILSVILAVLVYKAVQMLTARMSLSRREAPVAKTAVPVAAASDSDIVATMRSTDKNVVVFYGSQTGTAEEYAGRIARNAKKYGFRSMTADLQDYDLSQLAGLKNIKNSLAIFCMATYGEGDPTDNAAEFWEYLKDRSDADRIDGVRFAVFGLGNKTYEFFNAVARFVDEKLAAMGGTRIFPLGEGDDDANLEEDFASWEESFWPDVCERFGLSNVISDMGPQRDYAMSVLPNAQRAFRGEMGMIGAFEKQKRPFHAKNPFLAKVHVKRELFKSEARSCLHVELDITGSGIRYSAGDHVAIYPTNDSGVVEQLAGRLGIDLDQTFTLTAVDEYAKKKSPFPTPCSFRTALMHYVDVSAVPHTHILREMIHYTADSDEQERLRRLTARDGKKEFHKHIVEDQRTVLQLLQDMPHVQMDVGHLLELLPRLQPRYYSISSSPKMHPSHIHVTAAVVRYETPLGHARKGVCTSWLEARQAGSDLVPIFVRQSTFRLPPRVKTPIVMVGPGTGLAPFRGFIQERHAQRKKGEDLGDTLLFFGCQKRAEHFLYEEELLEHHAEGTISHLHLAFSRDQDVKVYVQHLLLEEEAGKRVYDVLCEGGHLYVCGDARHMARDVNNAIVKLAQRFGGKTEQQGLDWVKELRKKKRYTEDVWS